jgi:hypothetical protein
VGSFLTVELTACLVLGCLPFTTPAQLLKLPGLLFSAATAPAPAGQRLWVLVAVVVLPGPSWGRPGRMRAMTFLGRTAWQGLTGAGDVIVHASYGNHDQ